MSAILNIAEFSSNLPQASLSEISDVYEMNLTLSPVLSPKQIDPSTRKIRFVASEHTDVRLVDTADPSNTTEYFFLIANKPEYIALSGFAFPIEGTTGIKIEAKLRAVAAP